MKIRTIDDLDVRGKYVLLRDDFNVQIVDGKITDTFRIEQSMPTINALRAAGARIAIVAHLGRPRGARNMEYSLAPVAEYMHVPLIDDCGVVGKCSFLCRRRKKRFGLCRKVGRWL